MALGIFAAGIGVLAAGSRRWRWLAALCGLLAALAGASLLTSLNATNAPDGSLGIRVNTLLAAAALLLASLGVLAPVLSRFRRFRNAIAGVAGTFVVVLASLILAHDLIDTGHIRTAPGGAMVGLAAVSGLLLGGAALVLRAASIPPLHRLCLQPWMVWACLSGGLVLALLLAQFLRWQQADRFRELVTARADAVAGYLKFELDEDSKALERMARRWALAGRPPLAAWADDAAMYLKGLPSLSAIEWVDASAVLRRVAPLDRRVLDRPFDVTPLRVDLLRRAAALQQPVVSPVIQLLLGQAGFMLVTPVGQGSVFDGWLVGIFRADRLLAAQRIAVDGYRIRWLQNRQVVAEIPQRDLSDEFRIGVTLQLANGPAWQLEITPTRALEREARSAGALLFALLVALLALLTAVALNAALRAGRARRLSARMSRTLSATVAQITQAERRLNAAISNASQAVWEWDAATDHIKVDDTWHRMLRTDRALMSLSVQQWRELLTPEAVVLAKNTVARHARGESPYFDMDIQIRRGDGTLLWVNSRGKTTARDPTGEPVMMTGTLQDIEARVQNERQLRRAAEEKTVLLRELHHRVKNNLATVASIFFLQSRSVEDPVLLAALREAQARLQAMALLHESLYNSDDLSQINFGAYLRTLVTNVRNSAIDSVATVDLEISIEDAILSIDRAIPCGLIVNELVTNAMKHAWPPGTSGHVSVRFSCIADGLYRLIVADDGQSEFRPEDLDRQATLGLRLVRLLTTQIEGTLHSESTDPGTMFRIEFSNNPRDAQPSSDYIPPSPPGDAQ